MLAASAVSRYVLEHTSELTTSRWDGIVMVTTRRALPVYSQSVATAVAFAKHTILTTGCRRGRGQPPSAADIVDARDRRRRGGRQPSSREAHTACFLSPHL